MADRDFEFFRRIVLGDESLQTQLRDLEDRDQFVARVVDLGKNYDCNFSIADVEEAMRENRSLRIGG